jgi:hypothetical protein
MVSRRAKKFSSAENPDWRRAPKGFLTVNKPAQGTVQFNAGMIGIHSIQSKPSTNLSVMKGEQ